MTGELSPGRCARPPLAGDPCTGEVRRRGPLKVTCTMHQHSKKAQGRQFRGPLHDESCQPSSFARMQGNTGCHAQGPPSTFRHISQRHGEPRDASSSTRSRTMQEHCEQGLGTGNTISYCSHQTAHTHSCPSQVLPHSGVHTTQGV